MEIIRILSLRQYAPHKGRFSNLVFKQPSGDGIGTPDGKKGISVFDQHCAEALGRNACQHIAHFYNSEFEQPCAYWAFDSGLLAPQRPNTFNAPPPEFVQTPGSNGDPCHYNIHRIGSDRAKKIFDARVADGFLGLCVAGECVPFDPQRAAALKGEYYPDPS